MRVVLASGSPRRRELLRYIFDEFEIITPTVDEIVPSGILAERSAEYLAKLKCSAVANSNPDALVIGADTVVIAGGKIFGKPRSRADAYDMLSELSGRTHSVITGCCIIKDGTVRTFSQKTEVSFFELSGRQIEQYIKSGEPMDKAGAYGIQGQGALFIEKINGDYYNVVGLPVARLNREIDGLLNNLS